MIIHSKHDGWVKNVRLVYGGDSSAPTNQKVEQTNIPEYARPYVEDMLGRSHALTTQNPYQQYGGARVADATGLQQQSYNAAASMQPAGQIGMATGIASNVANQAPSLTRYNSGSFGAVGPMMTGTGTWNGNAAQQYMNPYMQQVVDIQKREAMRNSDIMGEQENAQATGMGAFGGSRHAIVEAERQRNLGTQLNDIQAQGSNAAWQQAMQAFQADQGRGLQSQMANQGAWTNYAGQNLQAQQLGEQSRQFGAGLGLQGLQTQLGAGQLLQGLGQNQYNQQLGIAGLQNQFGTQQQATQQQRLDAQYQDFENRNMWPYKQLEFQNAILRGLPLNQTTTSMYEQGPSPVSQLAGLGTAMYGMSRMAKGGIVDDSFLSDDSPPRRYTDSTGLPLKERMRAQFPRLDRQFERTGSKLDGELRHAPLPEPRKNKVVKELAGGGSVGSGLADLLISQIN